jgi:hypothetical protein
VESEANAMLAMTARKIMVGKFLGYDEEGAG